MLLRMIFYRLAARPLALLVALTAAACSGASDTPSRAGAGTASGRQNLLLISIDTLRADALGSYGGNAAPTPVLDRLAAEGVRFDQAMTSAPLTLPAHVSMLTGQYPPQHGVRDNQNFRLAAEATTLPEILTASGYLTAGFIGAEVLAARTGIAQGFATYSDFQALESSRPTTGFELVRRGGVVVDEALDWIGAAPPRFFAWVHLFDPHTPYDPPPPFDQQYRDNAYAGEVAYVDQVVGRLLEGLRAAGHGDDTLVVFVADHGEGLGEHREQRHALLLYESTLRVPLIIWAPGRVAARRVVLDPVHVVDLLPTIVSLLGLQDPLPATRDGVDLTAALEGAALPERALYAETVIPLVEMGWRELRALRVGKHKYIGGVRGELFDLEADPGERTDLSASEPDRAARLQRRLEDLVAGDAVADLALGDGFVEPADVERLRALGYLGAGGAVSSSDSVQDPRDGVERFEGFQDGIRDVGVALAQRRWDDVETIVRGMEVLVPGHHLTRYYRGRSALLREDALTAIEHFDAVIAAAPAHSLAYTDLATAYKIAGRPDQATELLRLGRTVFPDLVTFPLLLGAHLHQLGDLDGALEALIDAMRLQPRHAQVLRSLVALRFDRGEYAAAFSVAEDLVELAPGDPDAWQQLGQLGAHLGRLDASAEALARAANLAPERADIRVDQGLTAELAGRPDEAVELFRQAIELDPAFELARQQLARILADNPR